MAHLGSCHLGEFPWEDNTWEKSFEKYSTSVGILQIDCHVQQMATSQVLTQCLCPTKLSIIVTILDKCLSYKEISAILSILRFLFSHF